ncbi:uncharacterized protein [Drosophila kikkawai]|uniref:Uncharacterized protein n=1 Tax=Drosophila kikkawai TaxID=30033 RepID=A0A6P4IMD5_DROKI|nr:uncharacterized protein LOC108080055 [Drosophila kikkawai]
MFNYTKILAEQLGFPEDRLAVLAGFGGFVGGLRPAHKALMCVGAATVACMLVGLTVKSLKKRGKASGNGNKNDKGLDDNDEATGCKRQRMSINIVSGSQLGPNVEAMGMDKDTLPPQDPLQVDQGLGEEDTIAVIW